MGENLNPGAREGLSKVPDGQAVAVINPILCNEQAKHSPGTPYLVGEGTGHTTYRTGGMIALPHLDRHAEFE